MRDGIPIRSAPPPPSRRCTSPLTRELRQAGCRDYLRAFRPTAARRLAESLDGHFAPWNLFAGRASAAWFEGESTEATSSGAMEQDSHSRVRKLDGRLLLAQAGAASSERAGIDRHADGSVHAGLFEGANFSHAAD